MKLSKQRPRRAAALLAALSMVAAGIVLCRFGHPVQSATAPVDLAPARPQDTVAQSAQAGSASEDSIPALQSPKIPAASSQPGAVPNSAAAPRPAEHASAATAVPAKRRAPTAQPVASTYLPPFQPTLAGDLNDGPIEPPPSVLWLSGVIQGEPKLAILRRGENRYLVRESDTLDSGYRVAQIASDRVTLRRGGRTRVLRIGQY